MEDIEEIKRMSDGEYDSATFQHLGTKNVDLSESLAPQLCLGRETFLMPFRQRLQEEIDKRYGAKIKEARDRDPGSFIMLVRRDAYLKPRELESRPAILATIKKSAPERANRFDFVCGFGSDSDITLDDSYHARVHYYNVSEQVKKAEIPKV